MKLFFRRIHLYLSLVSGLFLVVVCLTGSILVFEEELTHAFHRERYFVETATTPRLPLAQLRDAVHAYKPKGKISSFKVYADPTRTVEVSLSGGGQPGGPGRRGEQPSARRPADQDASQQPRSPEGLGEQRTEVEPSPDRNPAKARNQPGAGAMGGPGGKGGKGRNNGPRVFVNPYTGAILGEVNSQESFFHFMEQIHRGLVAGPTGKLIMGINSITFLFILGTGLVLWWPAARKALTQRLKVKWGSGARVIRF